MQVDIVLKGDKLRQNILNALQTKTQFGIQLAKKLSLLFLQKKTMILLVVKRLVGNLKVMTVQN